MPFFRRLRDPAIQYLRISTDEPGTGLQLNYVMQNRNTFRTGILPMLSVFEKLSKFSISKMPMVAL